MVLVRRSRDQRARVPTGPPVCSQCPQAPGSANRFGVPHADRLAGTVSGPSAPTIAPPTEQPIHHCGAGRKSLTELAPIHQFGAVRESRDLVDHHSGRVVAWPMLRPVLTAGGPSLNVSTASSTATSGAAQD